MKIKPNNIKLFEIFIQKNSKDIEYDTIIKYVKKLAEYLENKFLDQTDIQKVIDIEMQKAIEFADCGITLHMHRQAMEILDKYWVYGKFIKKYK